MAALKLKGWSLSNIHLFLTLTRFDHACRAYDMAALKLKGYDAANTNFDRHSYHTEPFMMVCASPLPVCGAPSI